MSGLLQEIDKLPPERRALFERLLAERKRTAVGTAVQPIPRRKTSGPSPLSYSQERMWFFQQLEPEGASYNLPWFLDLRGRLDEAALLGGLREIWRRHEVLRTVFVTAEESRPVQVVRDDLELQLPEVDLRELPTGLRRDEMRRASLELSRSPFDLSRGPMLRTSLLRLGAEESLLVLVLHHIVTDGWSAGVLIRELTELYAAFKSGKPSPLPELPIQYADFAVWQRQWLEGGVMAAQIAYWKERLAGLPPVLELPADRPRPAVQSLAGRSIEFSQPASWMAPLRELARQHDATLFMVLLAVFKLLLYRYSGQEDLAVGSPIANRRRVETEELIGFFVNTLVLRTSLGGAPAFPEILERVKATALGAYAHQDVPFEKLVEVMQPSRDISHTPIFQVMFALQNMPVPAGGLSGLTVTPLDPDIGTAQFDLTLTLTEEPGGGLAGVIEYNTALFDSTTALRIIGHFGSLVRWIGEDPRASSFDLLTEAERHQLLEEWNDSATPHVGSRRIQDLFVEQAARTPDAEAVAWPGGSMTYAELDRRSNRLARRLQAAGVRPGSRVGICLPRSPELIWSLLGTLKAGSGYIPLDPSYPADRLAFMLGDSGAGLLITTEALARELKPGDRTVVPVDAADEISPLDGLSDAPVESAATSDDLVYMIYTSGSTGRPKAVLITQRSLVHHCLVIRERYALGPGDRVLQFVSISFDVAAQEIFPTLISGAAVVLRGDDLLGSIDGFVAFIEEERLSVLNIPTSYWQEWVLALDAGGRVPESVRVLIVGTEVTLSDRWREWLRHVGDRVRIINGYGPTEATIESTFYEPQPERTPLDRGVPIGRPFADSRAHVVDRHGNLLPIGVPGELLVTGEGLAWGYFQRPDLTADKFVPDPFSAAPGGRLYRTGDLARYRTDGNLDCLGRVDDQVKVRGFRVELGEIEAALAAHPELREAAVLAQEEKEGVRRLVAYVVAAAEPAPTVGDLRAFLEQRLPSYMVPSGFVLMPALPLSPNGKVDRRALQRAGGEAAQIGEAYVPPRDELESAIAGVWREVLRAERVGVHDNFFDLGGHSLLMVQIQGGLRAAGLEVTLLDMFRYPTVSALAAHLGAAGARAPSIDESFGRGERRSAALRRRQQARGREIKG